MELKKYFFAASMLVFTILIPIVSAQQEVNEIQFLGIKLEEGIGFIVFIISLILFFLTFIAYRRDGRIRFLFVSIAFFLFAVKSFLDSLELFMEEIAIFGPISVILELFVILFFFFGVIKKEG